MPYFIRVLTPEPKPAPPAALRERLSGEGLLASVHGYTTGGEWSQLLVSDRNAVEVCLVHRNPVEAEGLGKIEIDEFLAEVKTEKPASAAKWIADYLATVRSVYAVQFMAGAHTGDGPAIIRAVKLALWQHAGGIVQGDFDGFSNEQGYHILWQFKDEPEGERLAAVLEDGQWRRFKMDLADPDQRDAFLRGEVPAGAELVEG